MGLSKRNKVSAEFSMSSLTDIIFLLLIFFMLTSTLVRLDRFELPKSDSKTVAPTSITVTIEKNGKYTLNGKVIKENILSKAIRRAQNQSDNKSNATLTIVAEVGVPYEKVIDIMSIANRFRMKAIIATQARS